MSEEIRQKDTEETAGGEGGQPEQAVARLPEMTINRATKELTVTNPATGETATFKVNVIEPEEESEEEAEEEAEPEPLTPDQFRDALQRIDALGLTWTADRQPRIRAKDPQSESILFGEEFQALQTEYPSLPRELSVVAYYALTGNKTFVAGGIDAVGGPEFLEQKATLVHQLLANPEYRSEFFFKHAIKVPYFESVDWEVVLKTHEKNVDRPIGVPYALLLLTFHNTNSNVGKIDEHRNLTVAADVSLINKLIASFVEVKTALESSLDLTRALDQRYQLKGESDGQQDS
jgi:hypothetical protein